MMRGMPSLFLPTLDARSSRLDVPLYPHLTRCSGTWSRVGLDGRECGSLPPKEPIYIFTFSKGGTALSFSDR